MGQMQSTNSKYGSPSFTTEGSCDAEDWRNDAENSALHCWNKLHFKAYSRKKQVLEIVIIFHNITVFTVFLIK